RAGCSAIASRREWRPAPTCWTPTWRCCRPSWIEPRRLPTRTSPMPGWRGRWANERDHGDRSHETLRRFRRRRSADVRGRPGRGVRIPRQQRARQVDDDPDAVRPAETDEPTGGVDPLSRREFWGLIDRLSASGVTVLVTTHYLDEAEHCHRLAIIHRGLLAALGTTDELKRLFGDRAIVEVHAANPVETMRLLDRIPGIEKTSVFGTSVHAVLKDDPRHSAPALK